MSGSRPQNPRVTGHEAIGWIEALGAQVTGLAIGDRAVLDPVISCGHCHACLSGRPKACGNLAVIGVHRDGGMRQLAMFPASNVIRVPEALSAKVTLRTEANENALDRRPHCAAGIPAQSRHRSMHPQNIAKGGGQSVES